MAVMDDKEFIRLVKSLSDAAIQNDATTFTQVLGFRRRSQAPSIDDPLLCCSSAAIAALQERLFVDEGEQLPVDTTLTTSVIRALLFMSPSIYETPWQTACEIVRHVNQAKHVSKSGSSTASVSTVVNIQAFLQRTVAFWWEEERKRTAASKISPRKPRIIKVPDGEALSNRSPRQWILELVTIITEPLLAPENLTSLTVSENNTISETSSDDLKSSESCCTAQLDLLSTVVSLSADLEKPLFDAVLDIIFHNERRILSCRIGSWSDAAADLRVYLRDKDWRVIRSRLQVVLDKGDSCTLSCRELSGLAQTILSFSLIKQSTQTPGIGNWVELIVKILSIAGAKGLRTLAAVEGSLESDLASFPSHILMDWTTTVFQRFENLTSMTSKWVLTNLYLLVARVSERSGSKLVSRLVAKTPGLGTRSAGTEKTPANYDMQRHCWEQLVRLVFPMQQPFRREEKSFYGSMPQSKTTQNKSVSERIPSAILLLLRQTFHDLRYSGQGRMVDKRAQISELISVVGCNVFHSLFVSSVEGDLKSSRIHAVKRAKTWLQFSRSTVESIDESTGIDDLAVAVVVLVTIYCEIPICRSLVVQTIQQALVPENNFGSHVEVGASVYSLVISIILRSVPDISTFSDSPSKELDPIIGVFREPLPLAAFCDLAWSLSPLPAARRALFEASNLIKHDARIRKTLAIAPYGHGSVGKGTSEKCALMSLVVLVSTSIRWDDNDIAASLVLSEIIVKNRPSLSVQTRSWLFEQLYECTQKNMLRWAVSRHLLRACTLRILHFVANDESGHTFFIYRKALLHCGDGRVKQIEDLIGLFRLLFIIIREVNSENTMIEEERNTAFRECVDFLYRAMGNGNDATDRAAVVQPFSLIPYDDSFIVYVAFYCFGAALNIPTEHLFFNGKRLPNLADTEGILLRQQCEDMEACNCEKTKRCWVHSPELSLGIDMARSVPFENQHAAHTRLWLYWIVADLLLDNAVLDSKDSNFPEELIPSSDTPARLALCIGEAFARRRELTNQLPGGKCDTFPHTLQSPKELFDLAAFFKTVVPVTAQAILKPSRGKIGFSDVVNLLLAIVDACDLITAYPEGGTNVRACWLPCLWQLYSTICQHDAATKLHIYLTGNTSDSQPKSQTSLQSHDEIDQFVCRLRVSTIRAIQVTCVNSESLVHQPSLYFNPNSSSVDGLGFCKIVDQLIDDLKAELCGMRGLNYEEYLAFIDCIDQCTTYLLAAVPVIATHDEAQSISDICTNSSRTLSVILCTFVLKDVLSFNKTMMLFARAIPALARCVDRRRLELREGLRLANDVSSVTDIASFFTQLTLIAQRRAESGLDTGRQWREIVGAHHFEGDSDGEGICYGRDEIDIKRGGSFRKVIDDSSYRRVVARASDGSKRKLRLWSERSWARALFCFLQAFDDSWEDSFGLITSSRVIYAAVPKVRKYYAERKSDLGDILKCLYPLFQLLPVPDRSDSAIVYTMSLPKAIKSKLISTIDRIFQVLQISLKLIIDRVHDAPEDGVALEVDASFAESLCCFFSWLEITAPGAELSSGIHSWYMAEKQEAALLNKNGTYSPEAPILRCLPKLIFRIEDFEHNVRKFSQQLRSISNSKSNKKKANLCTAAFIVFLDGLVSEEDSEKSRGALACIVSKKLKFLKDEQRHIECVFGTNYRTIKKRKRTPNLEIRIRKERRRRLIRSRNAVVDRWLQMDTQVGLDEGQNQDAFAELEDFIVDG